MTGFCALAENVILEWKLLIARSVTSLYNMYSVHILFLSTRVLILMAMKLLNYTKSQHSNIYTNTKMFKDIHVKSPSLGGNLPLFEPISLLNIHLPLRSGNLPLFEPHFLPIIFILKRVNFIKFCNENALLGQQSIHKYNYKMLCIIWRVLSHYKEGISHHFQNFSRNMNVDGQN